MRLSDSTDCPLCITDGTGITLRITRDCRERQRQYLRPSKACSPCALSVLSGIPGRRMRGPHIVVQYRTEWEGLGSESRLRSNTRLPNAQRASKIRQLMGPSAIIVERWGHDSGGIRRGSINTNMRSKGRSHSGNKASRESKHPECEDKQTKTDNEKENRAQSPNRTQATVSTTQSQTLP